MTLPEVLLWTAIRPRVLPRTRFRRQHPFGPYILDFFSPSASLCVEIDGYSHGMGDAPAHDALRDRYLADRGVRTLRLEASDVLRDLDSAVETIVAALPPQSASPTAPPEGEHL
jgi:very-short-patch-repair endonuclease